MTRCEAKEMMQPCLLCLRVISLVGHHRDMTRCEGRAALQATTNPVHSAYMPFFSRAKPKPSGLSISWLHAVAFPETHGGPSRVFLVLFSAGTTCLCGRPAASSWTGRPALRSGVQQPRAALKEMMQPCLLYLRVISLGITASPLRTSLLLLSPFLS